MLSRLSALFNQLEKGDETVGQILIDQLDADLETESEYSGRRRNLLDAVLRAPSRTLFDRANEAFMTRGSGRFPETAVDRWSRWLRDDTFTRESYNRDSRSSVARHGALASALEGLRPWAIEEVLDREAVLHHERGHEASSVPPKRTTVSLLEMLTEHGIGHRTEGVSLEDHLLDVLKVIQRRCPGSVDDWMTPLEFSFFKVPAALALARMVEDDSILRWFVNDVGVPLNVQGPGGESWVSTLHDQPSLKGLEWLLEQGYDWDSPLTLINTFNEGVPHPTLHALLNARANTPLGERPDHWEKSNAWDREMANQQHVQALLLRYENRVTDSPLPRLDRTRL